MKDAPSAEARTALTFEEVYRTHFDFVWRVLGGMRVPPAGIEDAAQEVFLIVLRRLPEFDGKTSIKGWLFQIALRVASNQRRSMRRKGEGEPIDEAMASSAPSPADAVESRRALATVQSVLDKLDDDLRIVLVLTELEQMTAVEIAETIGVNANTVGSRLRRARRLFQEELSKTTRGEEP
jgi:RNA polymerase sigma-70 factor (ECF subfamily)